MKISDLISDLQECLETHGDIRVVTRGEHYGEYVYGNLYNEAYKNPDETYGFELVSKEDIDNEEVNFVNPEMVLSFE